LLQVLTVSNNLNTPMQTGSTTVYNMPNLEGSSAS
jgi:hypothetical protein